MSRPAFRLRSPAAPRVVVLAVPALLVLASVARASTPAPADGFVVERGTIEIAPHEDVELRRLVVDNRLGDVSVVGHDGPTIRLETSKRAPDGATLERIKVKVVPDPAGEIRVAAAVLHGGEARPLPARSVRVDLKLVVPRHVAVDVRAWNGKLAVSGLRNGAVLTAQEADISVDDVRGVVATNAGRGRQRLRAIRGAVTCTNTTGELSLDDVSGESLAASVYDGSIVARRIRSRRVRFRTTFGDIDFRGELLAGGHYDLRSYRGAVTVRFVPTSRVAFDARARSGAIDSQLAVVEAGRPEVGRLVGTYGPGHAAPAVLEVSSVAGSVRLGLLNE